jgi:hypothetical protein
MPILNVEQFREVSEVEPTSLIAELGGCEYVERDSAYPCSAPRSAVRNVSIWNGGDRHESLLAGR